MPNQTNKTKEGIEYQVCSLEFAERLEKLGVKQESFWWWILGIDPDNVENSGYSLFTEKGFDEWYGYEGAMRVKKFYSAFTVSEAIKILGEKITIPKDTENIADFVASKIVDKLSAKV